MALIRELVDAGSLAFHVDFRLFLWKGPNLGQLLSHTGDFSPRGQPAGVKFT